MEGAFIGYQRCQKVSGSLEDPRSREGEAFRKGIFARTFRIPIFTSLHMLVRGLCKKLTTGLQPTRGKDMAGDGDGVGART
jgi:hypothetical protein